VRDKRSATFCRELFSNDNVPTIRCAEKAITVGGCPGKKSSTTNKSVAEIIKSGWVKAPVLPIASQTSNLVAKPSSDTPNAANLFAMVLTLGIVRKILQNPQLFNAS
jgi:hypothetical protein